MIEQRKQAFAMLRSGVKDPFCFFFYSRRFSLGMHLAPRASSTRRRGRRGRGWLRHRFQSRQNTDVCQHHPKWPTSDRMCGEVTSRHTWAGERLQEERRTPRSPTYSVPGCSSSSVRHPVHPRANHAFRTFPCSEVAGYTAAHSFVGHLPLLHRRSARAASLRPWAGQGANPRRAPALQHTEPPGPLRSISLPVIRARHPHFVAACVAELDGAVACHSMGLQQASDARALLLTEGQPPKESFARPRIGGLAP